MNEFEPAFYVLIGIMTIFFLTLLLFGLIQLIQNFSQELRSLNTEISRTRGAERRYWISRRRRLWLSLLPFVKY